MTHRLSCFIPFARSHTRQLKIKLQRKLEVTEQLGASVWYLTPLPRACPGSFLLALILLLSNDNARPVIAGLLKPLYYFDLVTSLQKANLVFSLAL